MRAAKTRRKAAMTKKKTKTSRAIGETPMMTTHGHGHERLAIPGAGVDASESQRPGVPMETTPRPAGAAHWTQPERQVTAHPEDVLKRKDLTELTPVFSTATPPRGLSGAMRRAAYDIPEHFTSHWAVLLLADRVDALEERARRILPFALPLIALGAVALTVRQVQRRRRSRVLSWLD